MSIENDLLSLKAKGEQLNTQKIQNATKLAALEEEKNKLLLEAKELGIDPSQLEQTLKTEEASIQLEVSKLGEELNRILDEIGKI
jgi:methylphosphotriester-DNA--protein-cysteine methyltransferase